MAEFCGQSGRPDGILGIIEHVRLGPLQPTEIRPRCWTCNQPVVERHQDDGGPPCCSARCLRAWRADLWGSDDGPGEEEG